MSLDVSDRTIGLPDPSLVFLLGARGAGKSTFARRFFDPSEIVSMDVCRKIVGDDVAASTPSAAATTLLYSIVESRLDAGKLVVVDAENTSVEARRALVSMARKHHLFAIAIAFQIDERLCIERNAARNDCVVSPYEVKRASDALRKAIEFHGREGIRDVHVLGSPEAVATAVILRQPLWTDKRDDHGPFDIIGDVHGCADELEVLLEMLGYRITWDDALHHGVWVIPPAGRRALFLGDLIDRGPRIVDSLRIAMSMVENGSALCIPGNHEVKLLRKLRGRTVSITHGLAETLAEFERTSQEFRDEVACFIERLVGHYVLDEGRLCVVHAGIKEGMQGRSSSAAREFGLYGETTGETDDYGLPVRHDWATEYRGRASIVYGHTPTLVAEWVNNTICIDTGCVFGGALTALRYPEREIVSVPAAKQYFEPRKPLAARTSNGEQQSESAPDDLPDLDALRTSGVIKTRFQYDVAIAEERVSAVVEMMSLHCVDPRWLVYLPPVTSPVDVSAQPGLLEHPAEAFAYYRQKGLSRVVCQEKHEGIRVIVIVCRDVFVARSVFRAKDERVGIVYTRTGRPFFADRQAEDQFMGRIYRAVEKAQIFEKYGPFIVFEADVLAPIERRRSSVDVAGLDATEAALVNAAARGIDVAVIRERLQRRTERFLQYVEAVERREETPVRPDNLRMALQQILATAETSWLSRAYPDHVALMMQMAQADESLFARMATTYVELGDAMSEGEAIASWEKAHDAEAVVVKPFEYLQRERFGIVLPALEVRTAEALRLVYGPEFDVVENLERLGKRSLSALRYRALSQHALGMEALARFVEREPLYHVHVCICAALALECESSEPIT